MLNLGIWDLQHIGLGRLYGMPPVTLQLILVECWN